MSQDMPGSWMVDNWIYGLVRTGIVHSTNAPPLPQGPPIGLKKGAKCGKKEQKGANHSACARHSAFYILHSAFPKGPALTPKKYSKVLKSTQKLSKIIKSHQTALAHQLCAFPACSGPASKSSTELPMAKGLTA